MLSEIEKASEPFCKNGSTLGKNKSWISRLMYKSFSRHLTEEDIYDCSPSDSVEINGKRFNAFWQRECKHANGIQNASLFKAWINFVIKRVFVSTLLYLLCLSFGYLSGIILLRKLLTFIEETENNYTMGLLWAFLLVFAEFMRVTCFAVMYAIGTRTTIRVGSGLNSIVYKKLLSASNINNKRIGEITNLFTIDCSKVTQLVHTIPLLVGCPVILVITFVYSFYLFGIYSIFGISLFIISLWIQILLAKIVSKIRKKAVVLSDQRVSLISETMSSIKFVKFCALEAALFAKIDDIRKKEIEYLKKCQYLHCINVSLSLMIPIMATIITILASTLFNNKLTAVQAFTLVMLNNISAQGFRLLPITFREVIQAKISIKRLEQMLKQEDACSSQSFPKSSVNAVEFNQNRDEKNLTNSTLLNTNSKIICELSIPRQKLVGIVGSVGSGKTTLLKHISGEIPTNTVAVNGTIAYLSQQPFLFNDTIQENIIFGLSFNEKNYRESIECCGLNEDLKSLPDGDLSVVGEKALKLSGGQKQRVALSRAVYSDRDIYLLDDPLSALDVNTSQFVFQNCIRQSLKNKTVLMVTSQTMFLKYMDSIIFMKDGLIFGYGTHDEMLKHSEYSNLITNLCILEKDTANVNPSATTGEKVDLNASRNHSNDLSSQKLLDEGTIKSKDLETSDLTKMSVGEASQTYAKQIGGRCYLIAVMFPFLVFALITNFSHCWLSQWISKLNHENEDQVFNSTQIIANEGLGLHYYQIIYAISLFLLILSALISSFLWTSVALKASKRIHNELLSKILQSSVRLFERTQTGKMLHLFTRDTEEVDNQVPRTVAAFLNRLFVLIFNLITVIYVYPSFSIPMTVIVILFTAIYRMFKGALTQLKRIEANLRSPVLTHVCNTFRGLITIKIFNKEKFFTQKFNALCNKYYAAHYLHLSSMKWMHIRLDLLCVLTTLIASIFAISYKNLIGVSFAGLAITLSMQLSNNLQLVVRLSCEVETRFTAVERIACFIHNASIEGVKKQHLKSDEWPKRGAISFKNVSMKYGNEYPLVLKNVSFEVKPNEKIGIVGKTASGKSSLASALFRLSNYISGNILIDDLDTNELPLQTLRSKMTIIPQEVVLFSGTIRFNLDPYSQYTDEQLIIALEKAGLKNKVFAIPGGMDAFISENEHNFSVGEKRLFYIAKAFLQNSKIIVLDEATNCVDCLTENIIQQTINDAFENATVLVITHNLRTVLNCDRIFVMKNGELVDVGLPENLIQNDFYVE